jgi:hypothetical protein
MQDIMEYKSVLRFALVLGPIAACNAFADSPQLAVKTGIWEYDRVKTVNGKTSTLHNCHGIRAAEFVSMKMGLANEKQCTLQVVENTATVYSYKAVCRPSGESLDQVGSGTLSGRIVAESPTRVRVTYDGTRTALGIKIVEHEEEINEWRGSRSEKECKQPQMSLR